MTQYLGAGAAAAGFFCSWGMGFGNLIKLKEAEKAAADAAAEKMSASANVEKDV